MKKGLIVAIVGVVFTLVLVGSILYRKQKNSIPDNDISTVGNTAGNLFGKGLFCEDEDLVFFSNSYDGGCMYSMNADETNMKKVTTSSVQNIMAAKNHVYYYMDTAKAGEGLGYVIRNFGLFRSKKDGSDAVCMDKSGAVHMQLVGNYIFYQRYNNKDFTRLYKIKTDKSEMEEISDVIIDPVCAVNGTIYFNGTEKDHYLYSLNSLTNQVSTVYTGNLWYPQYSNGYIYFMDVANDYHLCRLNLSNGQVDTLCKDRLDSYNVGDYNIYYQKSDKKNPCLMRMNLDGSNPEVVAEGVFTNINLTSHYAYFQQFGDEYNTYHTPVYGGINVSLFIGAQVASAENHI